MWKKARTDRKREDKGRQAVLGLKQAAAVGKEKAGLRRNRAESRVGLPGGLEGMASGGRRGEPEDTCSF